MSIDLVSAQPDVFKRAVSIARQPLDIIKYLKKTLIPKRAQRDVAFVAVKEPK